MRTQQIMTGKVTGTTGDPKSGRFTSWRTSAGIYQVRVPSGFKLIEMIPVLIGGAAWGLIQNDQDNDKGCRVVIANAGGTVNIDLDWRYIAVVEGPA